MQFLMNNSTVVVRPGADRLTAHAWVAGLNPVGFLGIHGSGMCPDSISPVPQLLSDFSGGRPQQPRRMWQILPHLSSRPERFTAATGRCVMIGS